MLRRAGLACVLVLAACAAPPATTSPPPFAYLGQVDFPNGFLFDKTTVGGLSAISYDPGRQVYYVISDDRSEKNPARFYTVRITFPDNGQRGVGSHDTAAGQREPFDRAATVSDRVGSRSTGPTAAVLVECVTNGGPDSCRPYAHRGRAAATASR